MAFSTMKAIAKLPVPRFANAPAIPAAGAKPKYRLKLKRSRRGTSKPGLAGTSAPGNRQ